MMKRSVFFIAVGRISLVAALVGLLGAWVTQLSGGPLFGLSQQHLFHDATVLALFGIGFLVDGMIHTKEENKYLPLSFKKCRVSRGILGCGCWFQIRCF